MGKKKLIRERQIKGNMVDTLILATTENRLASLE